MEPNALIKNLDPDVAKAYQSLLSEIRGELAPIEGITAIHGLITERVAIQYVILRDMESKWPDIDLQRYNQLSDIFRKSMVDILASYRSIYEVGAANDLLAAKIMAIVSEVVDDRDTLALLRERIAQTKGTVPVGTAKNGK